MIITESKIKTVTDVLNGVYHSIKNIIPLSHEIDKPKLMTQKLQLQFGVLIGIIGDVSGKILFEGERAVFSTIGEAMYGMKLESDMLSSFSGELGNMIAAGLSTYIAKNGISSDITSPTIMEGNTTLSGFEKAYHIEVTCEEAGILHIYLLLD